MTGPTAVPRPAPVDLDDLRRLELFAGVGDEQLRQLLAAGTEVRFTPGEELFLEGRPADSWWLLLDGCLDLVRHVGREETVLGSMDVPGRWAGGFRAWDGDGAYLATARAATDGRVLRVPASALHDWATTWFPFGVHLLEGLSRTARNFETVARQKEALVALGTLAAGFAHEINNPAAAATRAVDDLGAAWETTLASVEWLASTAVTPDRLAVLGELRREVVHEAPPADLMALADREEELGTWLDERGVDRGWVLAETLAGAGADVAWCERVAAAVGDAPLQPALEWVAGTLSATSLLAEARESTRRISDLVTAVKSYTQLDRASTRATDVAEGLESTLVVLAHRIPPGVAVVREYDPAVPRIEAAAGELNQVWTHLVTNALDAMGGSGTLRVSTRTDRHGVVVEVGDTGSGMSPEVQQHAFDPFFTTKGVGEGTGLGLDISRRIVDRHHGEIAIASHPGETVLRVRFPVAGRP